jgi:hypothetical protein
LTRTLTRKRRNDVARVAQSVERILGKDEVTGSIPVASLGEELAAKGRAS